MSRRLQGRRGHRHADMKELGRQYRLLSAAEKQELKLEGLRATRRHKEGGRAFAKRARELERDAEADVKRRRGQAILDGTLEPGFAPADDGAIVPFADMPLQIDRIVADCKAARAAEREQDHAAAQEVLGFLNREGMLIRDRFIAAVPELAKFAPTLTGETRIGRESLLSWAFPAERCIPRATAAVAAASPELLNELVKDWTEGLHKLVQHSEQAPIVDHPRPANEKWTCAEARTCMDGAEGDELWRYKLWFNRQITNAFRSKGDKSLLTKGDVVIRLTSTRRGASDVEVEVDEAVEEEIFKWFHISLMFWNPVKPWVRELTWPNDFVDNRGHIHLRGTHVYYTLIEVLKATWRLDSDYMMSFYTLVGGRMPIPEIDPLWVRVKEFEADRCERFKAPRRPRPPRPPPPPMLDPLLDALEVLENDPSPSHDGSSDRSFSEPSPRDPPPEEQSESEQPDDESDYHPPSKSDSSSDSSDDGRHESESSHNPSSSSSSGDSRHPSQETNHRCRLDVGYSYAQLHAYKYKMFCNIHSTET